MCAMQLDRPSDGSMSQGELAACAAALPDPSCTSPLVEPHWRERMIREAAYFRSQHRKTGPGKELEDWLAAERQVDEFLYGQSG